MKVRAGTSACGSRLQPQVEREDVQHIEVLPLVFVDALHLHVEERLGRDGDAGALGDERGETALVRELHVAPLLLELRVVGERLELRGAGSRSCSQPSPMRAVIELREAGIAHGDEAPRRDAVGHVAEFLRPQLGEIAQHGLLQQLGVQLARRR